MKFSVAEDRYSRSAALLPTSSPSRQTSHVSKDLTQIVGLRNTVREDLSVTVWEHCVLPGVDCYGVTHS